MRLYLAESGCFRLGLRDSASEWPASSGVPAPLSLSSSLSARRDFSDVDVHIARCVGIIILALMETWPGNAPGCH